MKKNKKSNLTKRLFSFKKPLFIITTIIMAFIAIVFSLWVAGKCTIKPSQTYDNSTNSTSIKSGKIDYEENDGIINLKKTDDNGNYIDEYKISVIGDLHLNSTNKKSFDYLPFDCLEAYIKIEKPDLVILNGDTLCSSSDIESAPKELIDIFERNNQYWSFTLGNHDGECLSNRGLGYNESRAKAFKLLSGYDDATKSYAPHCLARLPKDEYAQYGFNTIINLLGSGSKLVKSFLLIDCNKKINITPWYENVIGSCGDNNVLINHIPFNQYAYACKHVGIDNDVVYHFGTNKEKICDDIDTSSLWNAILENGKTKDLIFSHDHKNNVSISYKDIRMTASLTFSFNSYTRRTGITNLFRNFAYMIDYNLCEYIEGATNLYIKNNEMIIGNKYAQFNGIFDNLKTKLYLAADGAITYNGRGLTIFNRIIYPLATAACFTYYGFLIDYHVNNRKKKAKTK